MVRVRALKACFKGNGYRNIGDIFEVEGDYNENVMIAVDDEGAVKVPKMTRHAKKKATADAKDAAKKAAVVKAKANVAQRSQTSGTKTEE